MVILGDTVAVVPAGKPLSHVTVPTQFATVKVALAPAQMAGLLTVGVGLGFTINFTSVLVTDLQFDTKL